MNLLTVRRHFVEKSGRYDLVVDEVDWQDNGADFYINAGQKFIERKINVKKSIGRFFKKLSVGEAGVSFRECRAIGEVWAHFPEEQVRTRLKKLSYTEFRTKFPAMNKAVDSGSPLYFTPVLLRMYPDKPILSQWEQYLGFFDVLAMSGSEVFDGVLVYPPTDQEIVIEVTGLFENAELTADEDETYWSMVHPEILLLGALYQLEVFNRNREGARDWLEALEIALADIDKDVVEEESFDINQMEG